MSVVQSSDYHRIHTQSEKHTVSDQTGTIALRTLNSEVQFLLKTGEYGIALVS